jgi:hypothetical protein
LAEDLAYAEREVTPPVEHLQAEIAHTEKVSSTEELRCVLAVIRHGDRTPKQKLKLQV